VKNLLVVLNVYKHRCLISGYFYGPLNISQPASILECSKHRSINSTTIVRLMSEYLYLQ